MENETLPVVDERDRVIGSSNREEVHSKGLLHREVYVVVLTPDKKVLLQVRKDNGKFDHSAGGHVKMGETYQEAAVRELEEELGLRVDPKELQFVEKRVFRTKKKNGWNNRFATIFILKRNIKNEDTINWNREELKRVALLGRNEVEEILKNNLTTTSGKYVLEKHVLPLM